MNQKLILELDVNEKDNIEIQRICSEANITIVEAWEEFLRITLDKGEFPFLSKKSKEEKFKEGAILLRKIRKQVEQNGGFLTEEDIDEEIKKIRQKRLDEGKK